ncbi:MAG: hypothetical protein IPL50_17090 [Chitinophagaceae bacterium]|nr:hypothetical protein [Chitinophagaceae bacterium]
MEFLSFLLTVAILIIVVNQNSKLSRHLQKLEAELKLLRKQLLNFSGDKKEGIDTKLPEKPKPADETKPFTSLFSITEDQVPVKSPAEKPMN